MSHPEGNRAQETMYRLELTEEELLLVMAVVEDYSAGYVARAVLEKCYAQSLRRNVQTLHRDHRVS